MTRRQISILYDGEEEIFNVREEMQDNAMAGSSNYKARSTGNRARKIKNKKGGIVNKTNEVNEGNIDMIAGLLANPNMKMTERARKALSDRYRKIQKEKEGA